MSRRARWSGVDGTDGGPTRARHAGRGRGGRPDEARSGLPGGAGGYPAGIRLDAIGRFADADAEALRLLRAGSVGELVASQPHRFAVLEPFSAERAAWRRAAADLQPGTPIGEGTDAVITEGLLRPLDGPPIAVRVAFVSCGDQGYQVLCYPIRARPPGGAPELYRIPTVLSAWRRAERRLEGGGLTHDAAIDLANEIELLRALHLLLFDRSANAPSSSATVSSAGDPPPE